MDKNLIYAGNNRKDIAVITEYNLDLAYGNSENDFLLEMPLKNHCCKGGNIIYIEDSEYGGIVDQLIPNTKENIICYKGRTWQGVLESHVICPESGQDYKTVSGNAYTVLTGLFEYLGLSELFVVADSSKSVNIDFYKFDRYQKAYTGILNMLLNIGAKMKMQYLGGKVYVYVSYADDYSQKEEWDSTQVEYKLTYNEKKVNHLICLGKGELRERKVIHLFADGFGNIQPYAVTDNPTNNSQYILTDKYRVFDKEDEIAEVYDYSGVGSRENYVITQSCPSDWFENYIDYYVKNGDEYVSLSELYSESFELLTEKPVDWENSYKNYYEKDNDKFVIVKGNVSSEYVLLESEPNNWVYNYKQFYEKHTTTAGETVYSVVNGVVSDYYKVTEDEPSDWIDNYNSYYICETVKEYWYAVYTKDRNGVVKYESNVLLQPYTGNENYKLMYTRIKDLKYKAIEKGDSIPKWERAKYYKRFEKNFSPNWSENKYYYQKIEENTPVFTVNKYYTRSKNNIPQWKSDRYYKKYTDDYAELVEGGLKYFTEIRNCDETDITLDASQEYDVGDIVGTRDSITGLFVVTKIVKKILKISKGIAQISYETGE